MTKLSTHQICDDCGRHLATVTPAEPKAVKRVLSASENDPDGRSNFVWIRLSNGDLALGVFPQGDTYEEVTYEEQAKKDTNGERKLYNQVGLRDGDTP